MDASALIPKIVILVTVLLSDYGRRPVTGRASSFATRKRTVPNLMAGWHDRGS